MINVGSVGSFLNLWKITLTIGLFLLCGGLSSQANAQGIVKLTVVKPKVAVYQEADFDSKVIYVLPMRKELYGTSKNYEGAGGLGLFHKVRLRKGVYGYVLDTDIKDLSGFSQKDKKKRAKKSNKSSKQELKSAENKKLKKSEKLARENRKQEKKQDNDWGFQLSDSPGAPRASSAGPFFFRRYAGLNLGMANYSEKIVDGTKGSQEWLAGLKLTGPGWIFKNLLVDINVNIHVGAPSFFEDFASDASGFIVLADLTLPFMLKPLGEGAIYGGIGPLISATSYKFNYLGNNEKSQNVRLGGVLTLGLGYDIGGFALRLEPKYYFENTRYLVFLAGIQKRL